MVELEFPFSLLAFFGSVTYGVLLPDTAGQLSDALLLFLPLLILLFVITRLKLSLHYMTRTIQMIDYQKHLYFCSCHNT